MPENKTNERDFARIFNMNNVLSKVIAWGAYFVVVGSVLVLAYLSFVERFEFTLDWKTIGVFSGATTLLSWWCWNVFFRKQYEKLMDEDINQQPKGKYSIHARYYLAIKDWSDQELQHAIDQFNDEYTRKWLNWVEKRTGFPIETKSTVVVNALTGEKTVEEVKGIKDLPYKKFKHKILMWRIKNHKYPQSGYKTSMELMSLFSYQDANFNKRNLRADKNFYKSRSFSKLLTSVLVIVCGASLIPEMISGDYWAALLKLVLAIGSLFSAIFMGAMNGVKGARLKLSIVEDACCDLEQWAGKKPVIEPYIVVKPTEPIETTETTETTETVSTDTNSEEVTADIFSKLKIPKE